MQELITCDLISPKMSKILEEQSMPKNSFLKILHAKSEEQSILRSSFLPSFLQVAKHNLDHKNFDLNCFEIGKIHFKQDNNFIEESTSALMLCGKNRPHHWKEKNKEIKSKSSCSSLSN